MKNRIITVSRQFGSGGRTIGKEVAERLGLKCYDAEIIEKVAEQSGMSKEYIAECGEYTSYRTWLTGMFASGRGINGISNQDYIWVAQNKVILDIVREGPCVIVGRCADYILRDEADLLKVFIHADMAKRAERIVKLYGENSETPEKRLRDKDKRRAAYYKFYTELEWGDAIHYDVALDSGKLGIAKCVDVIVDLYESKPVLGDDWLK